MFFLLFILNRFLRFDGNSFVLGRIIPATQIVGCMHVTSTKAIFRNLFLPYFPEGTLNHRKRYALITKGHIQITMMTMTATMTTMRLLLILIMGRILSMSRVGVEQIIVQVSFDVPFLEGVVLQLLMLSYFVVFVLKAQCLNKRQLIVLLVCHLIISMH